MKSLKTRNKSPVHYKYTWQRCANQSYLSTREGRQCLPCASSPAQPTSEHSASSPCMHTLVSSGNITSTHSLQDNDGALSASDWPTGVYWADNVSRISAGNALGAQIGPTYQDWAASLNYESLLMDFMGSLMQLFNLFSWYGRTDATFDFCLVWLQWHP